MQFGQLLIDQVLSPHQSFSSFASRFSNDPRFGRSALHEREQAELFAAHIRKLDARRRAALHAIFARCAPQLDVPAETALPLVRDDEEMERGLGAWLQEEDQRGGATLERLFDEWNEERVRAARDAFFAMLKGEVEGCPALRLG